MPPGDKIDVNDIKAMTQYKISLIRTLNRCIDNEEHEEYRRIVDLVSGNGKRKKVEKY